MKYYLDDEIKEVEMDRHVAYMGRKDKYTSYW
jgi:hypothetical protein